MLLYEHDFVLLRYYGSNGNFGKRNLVYWYVHRVSRALQQFRGLGTSVVEGFGLFGRLEKPINFGELRTRGSGDA